MNASYHFSATSFFCYTNNDQNTPPPTKNSITIPIGSPSDVPDPAAAAAARIQAAFRSHRIRRLVGQIRAADAEAGRLERLIQRQETVDAVRRDERERLRVGEELMAILLRLDGVPGIDPDVRDLRRRVSRRIVGLQEVLDAVVGAPETAVPEGFPLSLTELVVGSERGRAEEAEEVVGGCDGRFGCWERFMLGV